MPRPYVDISDILDAANRSTRAALAPVGPLIDMLPLTGDAKYKLKNYPVDGLLMLVSPVEQFLADIVEEANRISGRPVRRVFAPTATGYVDVDMHIDQKGDETLDRPFRNGTLRDFVRRMRIINNYVILAAHDPGHLAVATVSIGVARGVQGARWLGDFIRAVSDAARSGGLPAAAATGSRLLASLLPGVDPDAEGPMHRAWTTWGSRPFRPPEPPFISGLGEPMSGSTILALGGSVAGNVTTILVAVIHVIGTIAGAAIGGIISIKLAEIKARTDEKAITAAAAVAVHHDDTALQIATATPGWAIPLAIAAVAIAITLTRK